MRLRAPTAVIAALLGAGLGLPAPAAENAAAIVGVDEVIVEPLSQTAPVLGRFVATEAGTVAARINGAVERLAVEVGQRVKAGDLLVVLVKNRLLSRHDELAAEVGEARAAIEMVDADLGLARQTLARLDQLRERDSAAFSQARYDDARQAAARARGALNEAKARLERAQAALRTNQIDLDNKEVRAPYDGVVTAKLTAPGAYVNIGDPVIGLLNDTELEIEADVPVERLGGLDPGSVVAIEFADGSRHKAAVRAVVPEDDPLTRTRPVRFVPILDDPATALAANQSVTVEVPLGRARNVVTVHKDAVIHGEQGRFVYLVGEDGVVEPRPIEIGQALDGRFVVKAGLSPGDLVVIRGNERLIPFQKVQFDR